MIRLRSSLVVAALVAGCSPVEDGLAPDAPVVDTTPPAIALANPANMARRFSVLQPLTVVFDEDLDAATVNATTVVLTYDELYSFVTYRFDYDLYRPLGPGMGHHRRVTGDISYDAVSRTLRFQPKAPLPYGKRFTLAIDGVTDTAGNALTTSIAFQTALNELLRERYYSNLQPNPYVERPVDENGWPAAMVFRIGPGMDETFFTDDDVVNEHHQFVSADGRLQSEWFMASGDDGLYYTPDDTRAAGFMYVYSADGRLAERTYHLDAGSDMMWGTDDDTLLYLSQYTYTDGAPSRYVEFGGPGDDLAWGTGDDLCVLYWDFSYDPEGHRTREVLRGCGADNLPATEDDTYGQYRDHEYDANHAVTRYARIIGPGMNNTWFDGDDVYAEYTVYTVDANGLTTSAVLYTGAGGDGMWNSPDDVVGAVTKNRFDDNGQLVESDIMAAGMDGTLGTPDDVVSTYTLWTYDSLGNRVSGRRFDTGLDNMPYTGDDRRIADYDYDTEH